MTHHVNAVTCLFIVQEIKEKKRKRKIKSKKIDKKKIKSKSNPRVQVYYNVVLVNTRELGRVSSTSASTLYL